MNCNEQDALKAKEKTAKSLRAEILGGKNKPHPNLGQPLTTNGVPPELCQERNWLAFRWVWNDSDKKWSKLPCLWNQSASRLEPGFSNKNADHVARLMDLPSLIALLAKVDPACANYGLMFAPMADEDGARRWVDLDFDNIDPADFDGWPAVLQEAHAARQGWFCKSVSGKGVRVIGYVRTNATDGRFINGKVAELDAELKANTASTVTTASLLDEPAGFDITDLWLSMLARKPQQAPKRTEAATPYSDDGENDPEFMERLVKAAQAWAWRADDAVQGGKGSDAFYRVCCRIAGGFGLRGDEGRALIEQWNREKCQPPFSDSEVSHKWDNAFYNTENEFPALRQPVLESWREWQQKKAKARNTAGRSASAGRKPAGSAQAANSASTAQGTGEDANGVGAGADDAGRARKWPDRAQDGRWIVMPDKDNADRTRADTCRILANACGDRVYQRGGKAVLVRDTDARIKWTDPETGKVVMRGPESRPGIIAAEAGNLLPIVSRNIAFRKVREDKATGKKKLAVAPVPSALLMMIRSTPTELPPLRGLLFGPSYDSECDRVLSEPGYHPSVGLELVSPLALNVPDKVTRQQAGAAAQRILHCYQYFPWPESQDGKCVHRARLLVAMLTALLRWSFGPAPAIMLRGKSAGSGKTETIKSIAEIVHGSQPRLMSWVSGKHADDELRKRICALLSSGESMVLIDNVKSGSHMESPTLDALLTTEGEFSDRMLGKNDAGAVVGGPNHLAVFFTGNSIQPCNDLAQRVLSIEFDAPREFRRGVDVSAFGEIGELLEYVRRHRREMLEALITICRGYQQAGRPAVECSAWGTFGAWRNACVMPIAWALGFDPLAGLVSEWRERSTDGDGLAHLATVWLKHYGVGHKLTARQLKLIGTADKPGDPCRDPSAAHVPEMAEAIEAACDADDIDKLSARWIGRRLGAFAGKCATRTTPRISGTHIQIADSSEWCLMSEVNRATNTVNFWLEPFTGTPGHRDNMDSGCAGFESRSSNDAAGTGAENTNRLESGACYGNNVPLSRYPGDSAGTSDSPPERTNKAQARLTEWLGRLAEFAASPVSHGDLRAWMDGENVPDDIRRRMAKHLRPASVGNGSGVVFSADAEGGA